MRDPLNARTAVCSSCRSYCCYHRRTHRTTASACSLKSVSVKQTTCAHENIARPFGWVFPRSLQPVSSSPVVQRLPSRSVVASFVAESVPVVVRSTRQRFPSRSPADRACPMKSGGLVIAAVTWVQARRIGRRTRSGGDGFVQAAVFGIDQIEISLAIVVIVVAGRKDDSPTPFLGLDDERRSCTSSPCASSWWDPSPRAPCSSSWLGSEMGRRIGHIEREIAAAHDRTRGAATLCRSLH